MPLLANKIYVINKSKKIEEKLFLKISNELCESEEELKRKQYLYELKIWNCRISGQANLTFREAERSENTHTKFLKNAYKKCFEKATLQFVHNSKDNLDVLVHKAWTHMHQEFCANEPVILKIKDPREMEVEATIVKVDRRRTENQENEDQAKTESSTPEKEKKKLIPEKKKQFYVVKVPNVDKLVNNIPSESIERTLRPPSKDNIKMYIKAHACRLHGKPSNPWVVNEDLVKKYKLPSLGSVFIDYNQHKNALKEASKNAEISMYNKLIEEESNNLNTSVNNETDVNTSKKSDKTGSLKKMKQTTLVVVKSPQNRPRSGLNGTKKTQLPAIAQKLIKLEKEGGKEQTVKNLIFTCANTMSYVNIAKLPESVRDRVQKRKDRLEEKKKLDAMTQEERETYLTEKRLQLRRENRERKMAQNIKIDDENISQSKPLPVAPLIDLSNYVRGNKKLTQNQWSQLLSVCEFIRCYRKLLDPQIRRTTTTNSGLPLHLNIDELCQSILSDLDSENFVFVSIICVLLKPIMEEKNVCDQKELGILLADLPLTPCTTGELLRLAFPKAMADCNQTKSCLDEDEDMEAETNLSVNSHSETQTLTNNNLMKSVESICTQLKNSEIFDLSIEDKIESLELLKDRIMDLDDMSNFLDEHQREVTEAYKKRLNDNKELSEKIKVVRQQKNELMTLLDSMQSSSSKEETNTLMESNDISATERRKQSIELKNKENDEKERKLEIERKIQKLDKEESSLRRSMDNTMKSYTKSVTETKQLMRVQPLGYDRFYQRYWSFPSADNGIFVEKENETESEWRLFKTIEEIEDLFQSLNENGTRESALRNEIEPILQKMREESNCNAASIDVNTTQTAPVGGYFLRENKRVSGWPEVADNPFLLRGFKSELRFTEIGIRKGSLGGVKDLEIWENNLLVSDSINDLKKLFNQVVDGVRFINLNKDKLKEQILSANTISRLAFLQAIFDASIKWDIAAIGPESEKCRVCKRTTQEDRMLLCDGCNKAYHMFCLTPPLKRVPAGEWLCQACKLETFNKRETEKRKKDNENDKESVNSDGSDADDDAEEEEEETCCVCEQGAGEDEMLAKCSTCQNLYHSACHEPVIRHARKSANWKCSNCRQDNCNGYTSPVETNTVTRKKSGRKPADAPAPSKSASLKKRASQRNVSKRRYIESDNDENTVESESQPESDQEPEELISRTRSTRKRSVREQTDPVMNGGSLRKRSRRYMNGDIHEEPEMSNEKIGESIKRMLTKLYDHRTSNDFIDPVDENEVPDYYEIIKEPMCIATMLQYESEGHYQNKKGLALFLKHIALMFSNAESYNQPESPILKKALFLEDFFEKMYQKCGFSIPYKRKKNVENDSEMDDN